MADQINYLWNFKCLKKNCWGGGKPAEYNYLLTIGEIGLGTIDNKIGYSDGTKADEYTNVAVKFGDLQPNTLPYFFIINSLVSESSRLFIDSQEEFGGYIKVNGISQKLEYSYPGYPIDNSIANYLINNIGQTVPIYYSPDTPPPVTVDYDKLPNRNDTYRLEISFDNPCQYIRFINVTPDTETGSYFNYSCERIGEKQYQVVFNAYGALVQYNANMMLQAFPITNDDQQNIFNTFMSLLQTDADQANCQESLLLIDAPTSMPYHYEKVIDTRVELDMTMYKDYVDISKIATASDGLLVLPDF